MSRLTYEEAIKLGLGAIQIIDDKAYQLVSMVFYIDRIELAWRRTIIVFMDSTMVEFPGSLSYHKLSNLLSPDQMPDKPYVEEVVYRNISI